MNRNAILRDSYYHIREEDEESSESSGLSSAASSYVSVMSSVSTNKRISKVNGDTINDTTRGYRKAGNDGEGHDSIRKVCLVVFRKTWDEFYEWEREYCEAKLATLMDERRKGASAIATTTATAERARPSSPPTPITVVLSSDNMVDLSDALADFDADPIYESCTPLHGNIYVGDDPDVMPFLPFGEEDWDGYPLPGGGRRRFSYESYIKKHGELAWISEFEDPDLDCILYATTQRLISMSISYEQMDATGAFARVSRLPLLSASPGGHLGLEARAAKRVFPPFPGLPSAPTPRPPAPSVLLTFKTHIYPLFCHNLTCIQHICSTHSEDTPYPHVATPRKKSSQLADDDPTQKQCSTTCFLCIPGQRGLTGATGAPTPNLDSWSETERETLVILLELDADARPCDLAVIMKKNCNEIFCFRKRMFPDAMILSRNPRKASLRPPKRRVIDIEPRDHQTYTFPGPCSHLGSCGDTCPCVRANVPCERKCLCDEFCPLRGGCNCKPQRSVCCRTEQCPCRRAHRACNPEQCTGCAITKVPTCLNMAALWAANRCRKAVEVRKSAYGYGLYLKESILANEFLMEYTGEAILESTCLSRDQIIAHRERNYLFALNTTLGVDSSFAGDPSRFINHGDEGTGEGFANVYSHVEIANGGHGVMLYAGIDMDAGTELLLDYGPKFFNQVHDDGENKEENKEEPKEREVILRYKGYGYDDPEYGEAEEYRE